MPAADGSDTCLGLRLNLSPVSEFDALRLCPLHVPRGSWGPPSLRCSAPCGVMAAAFGVSIPEGTLVDVAQAGVPSVAGLGGG